MNFIKSKTPVCPYVLINPVLQVLTDEGRAPRSLLIVNVCLLLLLLLLLLQWRSSPYRALASSYEVSLSYTYRQLVGLLGRVISPS
jgi:hypothetical protein